MDADAPNSASTSSPPGNGLESADSLRRRSPTWGWAWELLAMTASLGSMAAVVAILAVMNNRELADWQFFLSIPATIAIFGMASKSAAAFAIGGCVSQYKWIHFKSAPRQLTDLDLIEEASRGPLGSLILLARRPMGLASIAAVVTLLALGFETFVQQMVEFNSLDVARDAGANNNRTAVLGLAHSYYSGAKQTGGWGDINSLDESTTDTSMQGAVFRGLFNLGSASVFNCSSRCQWNGTYVSLGFSSTCADVTDATLRLHPNASLTWTGRSPGREEDMANLTTPGGVKLDASYAYTGWQTIVSVGSISRLTTTNPLRDGVRSADFRQMAPDIARIAVLRVVVDEANWGITPERMEITECDVGLAIHRYSDLSSSGNRLSVGKHESFPLDPGTLVAINSTNSNDGDVIVFNQPGFPELRASVTDLKALQLLFASFRFSGNIFTGIQYHDGASGMGDAFRSGNIPHTFEAMVTSMTDQLRSNHNITVQGQTIDSVVFVQVQWAWLVLPLVVQLFSVVFLLLVLVQSGRIKDLPLWKSSTTAVLTYDVRFREDEKEVGKLGTGVRSKKELKNLADSVEAKLEFHEDIPKMLYRPQEDEKEEVKEDVKEVKEVKMDS